MNVSQELKQILNENPEEFETIKEMINEVAQDYNFKPVKTFSQVVYFIENCEIGREFLLC